LASARLEAWLFIIVGVFVDWSTCAILLTCPGESGSHCLASVGSVQSLKS
jgi:hypothetical protein